MDRLNLKFLRDLDLLQNECKTLKNSISNRLQIQQKLDQELENVKTRLQQEHANVERLKTMRWQLHFQIQQKQSQLALMERNHVQLNAEWQAESLEWKDTQHAFQSSLDDHTSRLRLLIQQTIELCSENPVSEQEFHTADDQWKRISTQKQLLLNQASMLDEIADLTDDIEASKIELRMLQNKQAHTQQVNTHLVYEAPPR